MKASIKPLEAPQRSLKIKFLVKFYFNTPFLNARGRKVFTQKLLFVRIVREFVYTWCKFCVFIYVHIYFDI